MCVHMVSPCLVKSSVFSFQARLERTSMENWKLLSLCGPPASPVPIHRDFPMPSSPNTTSIASAGWGTSELPLAFSFTYDQKGSTWLLSMMGGLSLKANTLAVVNQSPRWRCRKHKPASPFLGRRGLLSIWAKASIAIDARTSSEYNH